MLSPFLIRALKSRFDPGSLAGLFAVRLTGENIFLTEGPMQARSVNIVAAWVKHSLQTERKVCNATGLGRS
jgi:hypothetical protein